MLRRSAAISLMLALMAPAGGSAQDAGEPWGGFVSELKGGVFLHDVGRDNPTKDIEENTVDINGEILFAPVTVIDVEEPLWKFVFQPRPHLGVAFNTDGWTHHGYFGLTWGHRFDFNVFFDFAFGFAVHDGQLRGPDANTDRPNLGARVLFREGLDVGVFFGPHSLALHGSHLSNGGVFAKENDGMNLLGIRYGYRFDY